MKNPEAATQRANRTAERRKRIQESAQQEREKLAKLNEAGETVEHIFMGTNLDLSVETQETGNCSQSNVNDSETQPSNLSVSLFSSRLMEDNVLNEASSCLTSDVGVQTAEFDYLFNDTRLSQKPFTEDYVAGDDEKVRFYTGLPSVDILKTTFEFIKPFVTRRCLTLTLFQEFILVLMKLRLDVPFQDLAYRFDISLSTVSRIFLAWMIVMEIRLSPLINWPVREDLWRTMLKCFQYSFGKKTTVIIDCFEVFIERLSNLLARAQTFSNYKHHNTVKVLIGITPQGTISFVSNAWEVIHLINS